MMKKMLQALLLIALSFAISACNGNEATPANNSADSSNSQTQLQEIIQRGELILGTSGNMTPMTRSIDEGKYAVGFDVDLAKTMAETMGVDLVVKVI